MSTTTVATPRLFGLTGPKWRIIGIGVYSALVLTALLLYRVCVTDTPDSGPAKVTCRPLQWDDPPVLFVLLLTVVLLVGAQLTSLTWKDAKLEFRDRGVEPLISTGESKPAGDEVDTDVNEPVIALVLLGTAAEVMQPDAFLFVFYRIVDSKVTRYWYASSRHSQRSEPSLDGIAGSRTLMDSAIVASRRNHPERSWITPFPDQNVLLRLCLTAPVRSPKGVHFGVLMAVAIEDGQDEVRIGTNMLVNHLQRCADALGSALDS